MSHDKTPPVTQLAVLSFTLVIASGIWIVSHLPERVPLGPSIALLALSAALIAANVMLLSRAPDFDWPRFFGVAKYALAAYLVIAGMLEFVFIHDGTRGGELVVLTFSLLIFAIHVPLLIGYTVARYPVTYD